jgi:hypothetical protein
MSVLANLMTVLSEEHALAVIEHRRITIRKPLTAFAAKLLARRFAEWGNPNEAAEIMIERAWQGFDPGWVRLATRHKPTTLASMWRDEARNQGIINDTSPEDRRVAPRNASGDHPVLSLVGGTAVTRLR